MYSHNSFITHVALPITEYASMRLLSGEANDTKDVSDVTRKLPLSLITDR